MVRQPAVFASSKLFSTADIKDFFVAGIPDTALGTRLVVLVEGLTDLENVPGVLLKIKPLLDKGWVPKEILGITTFERTLSGKISRKESLKKLVR